MVNAMPSPISPRRPGAVYWLLALLGVPLVGVFLTLYVILARESFAAGIWVGCGAAVAVLAAAALGFLPRVRRMPRRARAAWTLGGAVLAVALAAGELAGLYVLAMTAACEAGGNCL
jgi:hypothetical protein